MSFTVLQVKLDAESTHRIISFVVDNCFVSQEEESCKSNCPKHGPTHPDPVNVQRRNLLGQYCKLIIHGVLPVIDASLVLRHYTKFYNDFGDILKHLLQKCKELDKVSAAKAAILALITSYEELSLPIFKALSASQYVDPNSEEFGSLKDLARRFGLSFGPDNVKNRDAVAMIPKTVYLMPWTLKRSREPERRIPSQSLSFLEVLVEFSPRLVRQEKWLSDFLYWMEAAQCDSPTPAPRPVARRVPLAREIVLKLFIP
uniref:Uncharacterized protein n=1 Tax=Ditylenchus dipsaci TaxID=166011 RepID=A0A915DTK7_9BILA